MDVCTYQETRVSLDEWINELKSAGWVWFDSDKPQPTLWNFRNDATSNTSNMLIRALKAGIIKSEAKISLERRLPMVSGKRFSPSKPLFIQDNGCFFLNTFKTFTGSSLLADEADIDALGTGEQIHLPEDPRLHKYAVEPFLELVNRLTANLEDRSWLLGWMAHMIQKPEERPSVHPLFRTEHGVGKNVLVEQVLHKLLCRQTVTTSLREIRGTHSESLANNLLVFVDESKAKGMNVYLELKSILTTSQLLVNPKHQRPYQQTIYSRLMFADNTQGRAFNIEQEDRRIYVMEYVIHECDKEDSQQFITEFLGWFNAHWELVYGYLLHLDISYWSPYVCPMTEAKVEYLGMCEDTVDSLLADYISKGYESLDANRWDASVIRHGLDEQYQWSKITCTESFKYQLEAAGFQKKRVGRANRTGYFLNGLKGREAEAVLVREQSDFEESATNPTCESVTDYLI